MLGKHVVEHIFGVLSFVKIVNLCNFAENK